MARDCNTGNTSIKWKVIELLEFESLTHSNLNVSGSRGLLREVWTSTRPLSVSAVGGLKTTAADYHLEVLPEASSPTQASFGESTSFSDRLGGFFVPPSDNNYTFYIQADDQAELYLSMNESAAGKVSYTFAN